MVVEVVGSGCGGNEKGGAILIFLIGSSTEEVPPHVTRLRCESTWMRQQRVGSNRGQTKFTTALVLVR